MYRQKSSLLLQSTAGNVWVAAVVLSHPIFLLCRRDVCRGLPQCWAKANGSSNWSLRFLLPQPPSVHTEATELNIMPVLKNTYVKKRVLFWPTQSDKRVLWNSFDLWHCIVTTHTIANVSLLLFMAGNRDFALICIQSNQLCTSLDCLLWGHWLDAAHVSVSLLQTCC